jgi:cytosine/adenosine deaminase-related metal-dependent hydrolase
MNTGIKGFFIATTFALVVSAVLAPRGVSAAVQLSGDGDVALLLINGRIHTPNEVTEAPAVDAKGVIVALGTTEELERLRTSGSRQIDLHGHAVLPGFHDLHVHPIFAGLQAQRCVIPQGSLHYPSITRETQ